MSPMKWRNQRRQIMNFDEKTIYTIQGKTKFSPENIEKVLRLFDILNEIFALPELSKYYALKGGTALNMFYFTIPRLSVDIDLNYQGENRDEMLENKARHEKIFQKLFQQKGYEIRRMPSEHAGGKWRLGFKNIIGQPQNLEVDLAYMLRVPLMPTELRSSQDFCGYKAENIRLLDIHELAAGKFCALLSRCKPRDLFDAHRLLNHIHWNHAKLRECFTIYAGFNKVDFSTIESLSELKFDLAQFKAQLIATLPAGSIQVSEKEYLDNLIQECQQKLQIILPFSEPEKKFLHAINHQGAIIPELVSPDPKMQENILHHPMLAWKALNVRNYLAKRK